MLNRSKRLSEARVNQIIKKSETLKTRFFVLKALPNQEEYNRYAVGISKKLEKSAVKRNYKKRQIYDILRRLNPAGSNDILILVRQAAMTLDYNGLEQEIQSLTLSGDLFGDLPDSSVV